MLDAKYVKINGDRLIIFPKTMMHSDFKHMNPITAGFVRQKMHDNDNIELECFGRSESLNLNSDASEDTYIANASMMLSYF